MKQKQKKLKKFSISMILTMMMVLYTSISVNATAGYAYSMGGLTTSVQQIIDTANNWALCGYSSYYNTDITYSYLSSSSVLNSDILYFSGPGAQSKVKLEDNLYLISGNSDGSTKVGLTYYSLSNTKLVVFNANYTANSTYNICTTATGRGADAAIGWVEGLITSDSAKWQQRFQSYLVSGHKVYVSMDYADSFTDYNSNYYAKYHVVYGNWNQIISQYYSSSSSGETQEAEQMRGDERIVPIDEITCSYDKIDLELFEKVISAYDTDYDGSEYEISVTPTSKDNTSFVVDITKMIGDYSTNSGYTFIFHDNKTDVMYDNTIDDSVIEQRDSVLSQEKGICEDDACKIAANEMEDGYVVMNQTVIPYCDLETGNFYHKVITDCKEINGDCCYTYSTLVCLAESSTLE